MLLWRKGGGFIVFLDCFILIPIPEIYSILSFPKI